MPFVSRLLGRRNLADSIAAKRKKEELKSVLEPSVRKRVGKCVVHSLCTR